MPTAWSSEISDASGTARNLPLQEQLPWEAMSPAPQPGDGCPEQRDLGQSLSMSSIHTTASDSGPPARGPPQTSQSVFSRGEVLQPSIFIQAQAMDSRPVLPQVTAPPSHTMQVVQAYPTLPRIETGIVMTGAYSPVARVSSPAPVVSARAPPSSTALSAGTSLQRPLQAWPRAVPFGGALATSMTALNREATPTQGMSVPKEVATPTWVIEEVIDFGLNPEEGSEPVREVEDPGLHGVCDTAQGMPPHYRGSLFDSCTKTICADEDKDRC